MSSFLSEFTSQINHTFEYTDDDEDSSTSDSTTKSSGIDMTQSNKEDNVSTITNRSLQRYKKSTKIKCGKKEKDSTASNNDASDSHTIGWLTFFSKTFMSENNSQVEKSDCTESNPSS
jgi:hypothetical protein